MKIKNLKLKITALLIFIVIGLVISIVAVRAWTNPSANPPSGGGALYYSGGNVGIGTTGPTSPLHIQLNALTPAINMFGLGQDGGGGDNTNGIAFYLTHNLAGNRQFAIVNTESKVGLRYIGNSIDGYNVQTGGRLALNLGTDTTDVYVNRHILVTGNVGIGTTGPKRALHVAATSGYPTLGTSNGMALFSGTDGLWGMYLGGDNGTGTGWIQQMRNDSATAYNLILQPAGGNVGIGTATPGNILTIQQTSATDPIADAWTVYSSKRWKENITPLNNSLDKIMQLQGVSFNWKADGKYDIGLIAEDVGKIVPEAVEYEENGIDAKSVDYNKIVPLLIESAKEQQKKIEELENKVNFCLQK